MKKLFIFIALLPLLAIGQQTGVSFNGRAKWIIPFVYTDTIHVGNGTTWMSLDTTYGFRMRGNATVFEDLRIDAIAVTGGPTEPALTSGFAGSSALSQRMFQGSAQDDQLFFNVQLPHAWKQGGELELHLHNSAWTNPSAGDTAVWELTYNLQNINDTFVTPTTVIVKQPLAGTIQWKHNLVQIVEFTTTGITMSAIMVCRLRRLANSNASDTYTGGMTVMYIDLHYEVDALGSRQEYLK